MRVSPISSRGGKKVRGATPPIYVDGSRAAFPTIFIQKDIMRLHDLSLATRVTIGALSMVIAGTATLLFFENARLHDAYLSDRRAHLGHDIETATLRLNQAIGTLRQDVVFLSNTPPVPGIVRAALNRGYDPRYGNTHKVWAERLQQIFSAFSKAHPDYYQIRYIGVADGGREIVRIDNRGGSIELTPPARLQARGDLDYFKATLGLYEGQVYLSEFNLDRESGVIEQPSRPILRAAAPVFTPSGEMFGMVVISMDADSLLKSAVSALPGIQTYIANGEGQYLLHDDSKQAFKFDPGSKDNIIADFPFIKTMFDPKAPDYLPLRAAAAKTDSPLFAARRIRFDSGDPSRSLLLMHYLPGAVVAEQAAIIPAITILYELMAMLLAGVIAVFILRRTFTPLKQIAAAADKIAAGNQDTLLLPTGGGEIGSLTSALNAMLNRLSQREILLRESETRYRRLHESMMDAYVMTDMSGRLLEFNHVYREMLGYSADELQRLTCVDLTPEKWHEAEARIVAEQIIPHGYSQVHEKEYIRRDGTVFPVELKTFLLRDANNQPEAMWSIVRDITERRQAKERQELLFAQTLFYSREVKDLYNSAPCGYHSLNEDGLIRMMNETELAWLGYARDEVIGKVKWPDLLTPAGIQTFHETFQQLKKQVFIHDIELELIRKDGTVFTGLINATAIYDPGGNYVMSRSTVADITGRKQMEQRLHDLTAHLQTIREEEKTSIAREIHDDLGGTLTAMKLETYWLKTELSAGRETASLVRHIDELSQLISKAAGDMRRIVTGLHPSILDDLSLLAAIEWQAGQFHKRTGIICQVNCIGDKGDLDRPRSIALFRIFQEALTNVVRHSGASSVEIEFHHSDEEIVMSIIDNGRGMTQDPPETQKTGGSIPHGILGMCERVDQLGGQINFDTPPGGGFSITVILPLPAGKERET